MGEGHKYNGELPGDGRGSLAALSSPSQCQAFLSMMPNTLTSWTIALVSHLKTLAPSMTGTSEVGFWRGRLTRMFITIEDGRSLIWNGWWNGRSASLPLLWWSSPSDSLDASPRASFLESCLQKSEWKDDNSCTQCTALSVYLMLHAHNVLHCLFILCFMLTI